MNDMNEYELYHHGVKGMRWGVRRYQNKDGSLTPAGKKRISKEYKKLSDEVERELVKSYNSRYVNAYNKAADTMNKGGIEKFNKEQEKKYGKDYTKRSGYEEDYMQRFNDELAKNFNKSMNDFYNSNKTYKKSKELVDKYNMTSWDELARKHSASVQEVRDMVNSYDD